ncbi:hypothetical protein B0T26DRAFT_752905 [Lasiosphaeria miniovina]|uniref:Uncharacterized protein n=1 Tax=Lasiosphaeria miniovina TaxID=1954250 RepID=A0AA40ABJ5_9PEZI|nr:uncharacterized protein B0T26DRAFT_752905 [Lasiosphaeria miniovina]KAK0712705.1 hypothetical protein B0T26DRAFT_752905 [Lasiosphaeria miniovina]
MPGWWSRRSRFETSAAKTTWETVLDLFPYMDKNTSKYTEILGRAAIGEPAAYWNQKYERARESMESIGCSSIGYAAKLDELLFPERAAEQEAHKKPAAPANPDKPIPEKVIKIKKPKALDMKLTKKVSIEMKAKRKRQEREEIRLARELLERPLAIQAYPQRPYQT